jgi:hypothetical protein
VSTLLIEVSVLEDDGTVSKKYVGCVATNYSGYAVEEIRALLNRALTDVFGPDVEELL